MIDAPPPPLAAAARVVPPARLLVQADEFRLQLSRVTLAPGRAIVQLATTGEDAHDLQLVKLDARGHAAGRPRTIPKTLPGTTAEWRGRLTRGRYKLFCSILDHEALGMRAVVRVR